MGNLNIKCDYCGKEKPKDNGYDFVIGASLKPDWVMVYGTEKMTCPDCHPKATKEGRDAVDRHVASVNKRARQA